MAKRLFGRWGWYLVLDAIIEGGRFDLASHTSTDSAMLSNFIQAMLWYAKEKEVADQQAILNSENE